MSTPSPEGADPLLRADGAITSVAVMRTSLDVVLDENVEGDVEERTDEEEVDVDEEDELESGSGAVLLVDTDVVSDIGLPVEVELIEVDKLEDGDEVWRDDDCGEADVVGEDMM